MKTNEKKGGGEGRERERKKEKRGDKKYCGGYRARYRQFVAIRFFFPFYYFIYFFFFHRFFHHLAHIYTHTHTLPFILSLSPNRIIKIHAKEKFILFFLHSLSVLQPFPSPWLFVTRPVTYYTVHLGWGRRVFEGGQDKRRGGGGKAVVAWRGRGPSTVILFQVSVPSVDGRPATCGITA